MHFPLTSLNVLWCSSLNHHFLQQWKSWLQLEKFLTKEGCNNTCSLQSHLVSLSLWLNEMILGRGSPYHRPEDLSLPSQTSRRPALSLADDDDAWLRWLSWTNWVLLMIQSKRMNEVQQSNFNTFVVKLKLEPIFSQVYICVNLSNLHSSFNVTTLSILT